MNLGDFILLPQLMHGRPVDAQQTGNLSIGFVELLADESEPRGGFLRVKRRALHRFTRGGRRNVFLRRQFVVNRQSHYY